MPSHHPKVERMLNGIVMLFFFGISLKISCDYLDDFVFGISLKISCNYLDDFVKGIISTHVVSAYPFLTKFMPTFLLGWEKMINIFKHRSEWFGTSNVVVKPPSIHTIVLDGVLCLWSLCAVGYPFYSFIFVDDDAFSQLNKYMADRNETVDFNASLVLGLDVEIVQHTLMACAAFILLGVSFTSFIANVRNKLYWPATELCSNDVLQDRILYVKLDSSPANCSIM
ncbi:hypothetical protein Ddc_14118 [Ditylenchus destructor]|nr:hypothetical protein Ddc_14118 [Ditylenchus destructor]